MHAVENPGRAIACAAEHGESIDLILSDVVLPDISGPAMAAELKAHCAANVLYMSGYTDEAIVHSGMLDPDTWFLHKPFTSDALARSVRHVIDHHTAS